MHPFLVDAVYVNYLDRESADRVKAAYGAAKYERIEWMREAWRATQPFLEQAAYVNDLGDEGVDRMRAAYGPNYSRLVALKTNTTRRTSSG